MDRIPTAHDFQAGRVTNLHLSEVLRQRYFDYLLYPAAGLATLQFFAFPVGQGKTSALGGTAGAVKTLQDTNMLQANALPSGMAYMVETLEVEFFPGSVATADTYTPASVSLFAAANAASVLKQLDDVNTFYQAGILEFDILAKNYLREPVKAFPPKTSLRVDGAIATTSATAGEVAAITARMDGRPYIVHPHITLRPAENFAVNIKYPAAVAMPSGFNGRVGVIADGYMKRASQ